MFSFSLLNLKKCILTSLFPSAHFSYFSLADSLIHLFRFFFCLRWSVSLCGVGESDDAHLSISGGCRLLRVSVFLESGQQEEAADPLWPRVQPTLQFRTQEICYRGRPKDIRLRCCFYPGCLTSKVQQEIGTIYSMRWCVYVCVVWEFSLSRANGCLYADRVWPGLREKNACLGSEGILTSVGLTAGPFKPSGEWFESTPVISNLSFHWTAICNLRPLPPTADISIEIKDKGHVHVYCMATWEQTSFAFSTP